MTHLFLKWHMPKNVIFEIWQEGSTNIFSHISVKVCLSVLKKKVICFHALKNISPPFEKLTFLSHVTLKIRLNMYSESV